MNICIFHNLPEGGAYNYLLETSKYICKNNNIDLYSFKDKIYPKYFKNTFIYPIHETNNILSFTLQALFELRKVEKIIAEKINNSNYDLIIVHHCFITQTPYILRYLKDRKKVVYILHEPKREYYENTSFDYFSLKKILSRAIRYPIKIIDKCNCKFADNIICNSNYSYKVIKKIYNKESTVIYPGLVHIKRKRIIKKNNNQFVSIGLMSKLKGFDELIKLFNLVNAKLTIIGKDYYEKEYLMSLIDKSKNNIKIMNNVDDHKKAQILSKSTYYIANQQSEPFGISTLEAANSGCYLIGNNSGGTPEIINNNINGILWNNNFENKLSILSQLIKVKYIYFYKITSISWKNTADQIIDYGSKIGHEN